MVRILKLTLAAAAVVSSGAAFAVVNDLQPSFGTVTLPFSQGFSNSFSSTGGGNYVDQHGYTISNSTAETKPLGNALGTAVFNFYDDYTFTLPTSSNGALTASAVSVSFGALFGINNLQVRLYPVVSALTTGAPASLVSAWSLPTSTGGTTVTVSTFAAPVSLLAGTTYALEVRGNVVGATGSYGGNLNISAVPETDGWLLSLAGVSVIGLVARRRKLV
jgi:hypothetical protein